MPHRRPTVSGKPDTQPNTSKNNSSKESVTQTKNSNLGERGVTTSHSHTISLTNIKNIRELLGGLSFERIIERLSKRKKIHLHAKISEIEDVMLQEIMEKRGIPNQSQIIREAIRVYFALLHGVKEFAVGNIIIKNPILNLNIAEAKAEASAEVDIELLKRELNIYKRRLKLCEEELKLQEKDTELKKLKEKFDWLLKELRKLYFHPKDYIPKQLLYKLLKEVGGI